MHVYTHSDSQDASFYYQYTVHSTQCMTHQSMKHEHLNSLLEYITV